jgi:hypothetical protein
VSCWLAEMRSSSLGPRADMCVHASLSLSQLLSSSMQSVASPGHCTASTAYHAVTGDADRQQLCVMMGCGGCASKLNLLLPAPLQVCLGPSCWPALRCWSGGAGVAAKHTAAVTAAAALTSPIKLGCCQQGAKAMRAAGGTAASGTGLGRTPAAAGGCLRMGASRRGRCSSNICWG